MAVTANEYKVRVSFTVYGVRDVEKDINTLLDDLSKAKTDHVWDDVDWVIDEASEVEYEPYDFDDKA